MGKLWRFLKLAREIDLQENMALTLGQRLKKGLVYVAGYLLFLAFLAPGLFIWMMNFVMVMIKLSPVSNAPFSQMMFEAVSQKLVPWTIAVNVFMVLWFVAAAVIAVYMEERYKVIWKKSAGEPAGEVPQIHLFTLIRRLIAMAALPVIFAVAWNMSINIFESGRSILDIRSRLVPVFCERTTAYARENLDKLRKAVSSYKQKKGRYPNYLRDLVPDYMKYIPSVWIYRHESTADVVSLKDSKGLEDSGMWCYDSKTGKVTILCTHIIKGAAPCDW